MHTARSDFVHHFYLGVGPLLARTAAAVADAFARAEHAHHRRLGFSCVTPEMLRDMRLSAEDATGLPSQETDLPFFMQAGFPQAGSRGR
jgi:hypothetical protein